MPDERHRPYTVRVLPSGQRDLDDLDQAVFSRVAASLRGLEREPRPHGCIKLSGDEGYRIRVGAYRVLYRIEDKGHLVFIYRIKHRREAYR